MGSKTLGCKPVRRTIHPLYIFHSTSAVTIIGNNQTTSCTPRIFGGCADRTRKSGNRRNDRRKAARCTRHGHRIPSLHRPSSIQQVETLRSGYLYCFKVVVFWNAPWSLVDTDGRFRGAYYLDQSYDSLEQWGSIQRLERHRVEIRSGTLCRREKRSPLLFIDVNNTISFIFSPL
jgi:hypothetical protein